ncbi:DUF4112 domain-containing protein [Azospirillum formosense]|uniref:DUF4112 domain-containing protein n=1 Tax=Azospirillum formosense TaxID=861533 RepID=A0ABX2L2K9_9PROT|nr:DUF4112 domain-containing protein [Azospirillum formosense]MBY3755998.1 DUF4112 domain-containing protein [Azospirillum formosense]NUB21374.1 DUF4112 domain-containing protein [Azospirillum formosense]
MTATSFSSFRYGSAYDETAHVAARRRLEWLARTMDSAVRVPGTNITFGADAVLGLVPGFGNLATTAVSGYLIREAWRLGVPRGKLLRMVGNVAMDSLISAVPVAGNIADVFWKANRKNMAILAEHLDGSPPRGDRTHRRRHSAPYTIDGEWRRTR